MYQKTIASPIKIEGIGIHSGNKVKMQLLPAPINTGIVFVRVDQTPPVSIKAVTKNVSSTTMSTDISSNGVTVKTIEHFMSALFACEITNLYIEVTSSEVPVMDGSAAPFIFLIKETGVTEQSAPKKFMKITRHVRVGDENRYTELHPNDTFSVDLKIDFNHPLIGAQHRVFDLSKHSFLKEIAPARTFGFLKDIEYLHANGMGLGGSTSNAVILDEYSILNKDGLRCDDEFVRHKVLDVIGDLYISGYHILGKYVGYKSGHAINHQLLLKVFEEGAYEIVTEEKGAGNESYALSYVT
jgi:UDP-3-O-[3-hydroxymyristoyl] N-acetylglucosamine deacetylase